MPWWARRRQGEEKEGRHEGFLSALDWGSEDLEKGEWAEQLPINSGAEFTE